MSPEPKPAFLPLFLFLCPKRLPSRFGRTRRRSARPAPAARGCRGALGPRGANSGTRWRELAPGERGAGVEGEGDGELPRRGAAGRAFSRGFNRKIAVAEGEPWDEDEDSRRAPAEAAAQRGGKDRTYSWSSGRTTVLP